MASEKKPSLSSLFSKGSDSYETESEPDAENDEDISEEGSPEAVFSEMMDPKRTNQERLRSFQALVRSEVTKMNGS